MNRTSRRRFLAQTAGALAVAGMPRGARASGFADARFGAVRGVPRPSAPGAVRPEAGSDLEQRTRLNFARLRDPIYRPPLEFRQTNWKSWPGDFEGRALLGVTLLSQATGEEPDYFDAMVGAYPAEVNARGYFGPLLDLKAINEQQLSGHGWYLRALCELYGYQRDEAARARTLGQIRRVVENLALPLRGSYAAYPIDPEVRARAAAPTSPGAVDGHLSGQHGRWAVSSDTGCAFIFLDGLTQAWVVLREANEGSAPAVKALADEALARFLEMDLVGVKAQTHASLTALRAVLRVYENTGDAALLRAAEERYRLYRTTAMTEHYANTNWFGRPESWTEPCAIIDSYMLATQLWQHTGDPGLLEDAHRIWFNGLGRGLRANGGFGTDTCTGATPWVRVRSYEAYFCCTMRGGEGHARAAQYLYWTEPKRAGGEAVLTVPFYAASTARVEADGAELELRQRTDYPYGARVEMEVVSAKRARPVELRMFVPQWILEPRILVNGRPVEARPVDGFLAVRMTPKTGDRVVLDGRFRVGARDTFSAASPAGYHAFEAGPLLLGYAPEGHESATVRAPAPGESAVARTAQLEPEGRPGVYRVAGSGLVLARINDMDEVAKAEEPKASHPRQVLFRESPQAG